MGNSTSTQSSQANCPIFHLPQELRDIIYTYVFTTETYDLVQLAHAGSQAPQVDLILTCRRINDEAAHMHQTAYAAFWTNNTFTTVYPFTPYASQLRTKHLEHMTKMTIDVGALRPKWPLRTLSLELCSKPGNDEWVHQTDLEGFYFPSNHLKYFLALYRAVGRNVTAMMRKDGKDLSDWEGPF